MKWAIFPKIMLYCNAIPYTAYHISSTSTPWQINWRLLVHSNIRWIKESCEYYAWSAEFSMNYNRKWFDSWKTTDFPIVFNFEHREHDYRTERWLYRKQNKTRCIPSTVTVNLRQHFWCIFKMSADRIFHFWFYQFFTFYCFLLFLFQLLFLICPAI